MGGLSTQRGMTMLTTVHLPHLLERRLQAWAREAYPSESCGVLIGRRLDHMVRVADAVRARNLNSERARDRFELDPEDFLKADAAARASGLDIVGIWHTHPDHPARPSETDQAAAWQGWSYLILSVNREYVEELRSWHLEQDRFVEEEVVP